MPHLCKYRYIPYLPFRHTEKLKNPYTSLLFMKRKKRVSLHGGRIIEQLNHLESILLNAPSRIRHDLESSYIELLQVRDALTDYGSWQRIIIQYKYKRGDRCGVWVVDGKEMQVEQVAERLNYFNVPEINLDLFLTPILLCNKRRYRKIQEAITAAS